MGQEQKMGGDKSEMGDFKTDFSFSVSAKQIQALPTATLQLIGNTAPSADPNCTLQVTGSMCASVQSQSRG